MCSFELYPLHDIFRFVFSIADIFPQKKTPNLFHHSEEDHTNDTDEVSTSTKPSIIELPTEEEGQTMGEDLDNRIDPKVIKTLVG